MGASCLSKPVEAATLEAGAAPREKTSAVSSQSNPAEQPQKQTRLSLKPPPQSLSPQQDALDPLAQDPNCRYRKLGHVNDGSSGFVLLAEDVHTHEKVAIKFLERGTKVIKDSDREICNLRLCCMHPYIVRFKEAFLTDNYLGIVSEYASMGDLADYIDTRRSRGKNGRGLPEAQTRQLFQQLVFAIDFCHRKGIVNRDLKLENVLLTKDSHGALTVKLCDFGFSKDEAIDSICKTACGTPEYVAPEVLLYNRYSGKAADMWSTGVMLYVMVTGRYPFRERSDEQLPPQNKLKVMFPRIVKSDFPRPTWLSAGVCDLLDGLLQKEPEQRLCVADVIAHPWFQEGLAPGAADLNGNLLNISDLLMTSFTAQTEDEILTLVKAAMRKAGDRRQSISHKIAVKQLQPDLGPLAPAPLEELGSAQRWSLSAAQCQDNLEQALLPSQRYHPHSLASSSSQYSREASTCHPLSSTMSTDMSSGNVLSSSNVLSSNGLSSSYVLRTQDGTRESSGSSFAYDDVITEGLSGDLTRGGSPAWHCTPTSSGPLSNPFAQHASSSTWLPPVNTHPSSGSQRAAASSEALPSQHSSASSSASSCRHPLVASNKGNVPSRAVASRQDDSASLAASHGDAVGSPRAHDKPPTSPVAPPPKQKQQKSVGFAPSPFAMVTPSDGGKPVAIKLPANIAADPNALACHTPDLPVPDNARMASGTTSVGSAMLELTSSTFRASSSDIDFARNLAFSASAIAS